MLFGYAIAEGKLAPLADVLPRAHEAVWLDMLRPTREEDEDLERAIGISIPTLEEMQEIEVSSRLYTEDGAAYMTALVMAHADADLPTVSPVTFILTDRQLVTVRYDEPRAFTAFAGKTVKSPLPGDGPEYVLVGLFEAIVERVADVLEKATRDIDRVSAEIFARSGAKPLRPRDYRQTLVDLGRRAELASGLRDCLVTLNRAFGFLKLHLEQRPLAPVRKSAKEIAAHLKSLERDVDSLVNHASFVSQKISFLLQTTLGMISVEQNQIIKIFSVAAVAFLPPTVIASVYGMNFEHMPELDWRAGYPFAIFLMILSSVLPLLYFKRRGWW